MNLARHRAASIFARPGDELLTRDHWASMMRRERVAVTRFARGLVALRGGRYITIDGALLSAERVYKNVLGQTCSVGNAEARNPVV